ncbi:F-box/kelch-repeat protein [Camellia lanceoleosa]|uniref:F-box/kelch-repeat protein n=1 Tax=Camellia lanceoleosa TaxID=1840588 RepID=A0ACC0FER3_9ERIC|nr:F-box/kelch-repeat protein [Camellia lanceoleosa]
MREQGTLASWHCRILSGQAELLAEFYTLWVYSDDFLFTAKFTESKGIAKPVRGKGLMNLNGVRVWSNSTGISLIQPKDGHPTLFLMNSTTGEVNKNIRDPPTKARVEYGIRNENEAVISFGIGDEGGDLYIGKVVEQDWACLYSLKKKRWSNISVFPYKSAQVSSCGVFLKNKIHWLVSREKDLTPVIVAMSLLRDLVEISVPEEAASGSYTLACFDSCLCLMHYDDNIAGQEE